MNRFRAWPRLAALLTVLCTCVGLLSLSTAPAWAAAGTVTEFPVRSSPVVITAGPDGALWFTECALDPGAAGVADRIQFLLSFLFGQLMRP